ncbi:MAG TPA: ATP-binding protein [Methylomirabilota bacterium]|jgi:signal transduction histidine kinase|nr:ATP-binding protein [Methylomirabilota bacterium]
MDPAPESERQQLRALVEHSSDLIGTAALDGRLLFVNTAARQLLALDGLDEAHPLMSDLVLPRYQSTVGQQILPLAFRDGQWEGPIPFRQFRTGQPILVLWTVFLITEPITKQPRLFGWLARVLTPPHQVEEVLHERERELRRLLQERKRLFEDLHDNVIQMLYAAGMQLEECRRLSDAGARGVGNHLDAVMKIINDAIREVRGYFALEVEPGPLSGDALIAELQNLADAIGQSHLIEFELDIDSATADLLTAEQATHVLAIAREAVSNSLQHGAATRVSVSLTQLDRHLRLQIADDGVGFDMGGELGRGRGLINMRTRAEKVGGALEVVSHRGSGTEVALFLPKESARGVTR